MKKKLLLINAGPGGINLTTEARDQLRSFYGDDVRKLETLIGRDLSHWLS